MPTSSTSTPAAVASASSSMEQSQVANSTEPLYCVADLLIQQLIDLLRTTVKTDEQLTFTSQLIPGSTIGKHLRHIHDHFRLLLNSIPSSPLTSTPLEVCYDTRSRNVASESSHPAAVASFVELQKRLKVETGEGRSVPAEQKVLLEAVTPVVVSLESTFARELWFTCLHATHHFALLRVVAVGELGLSIPDDFGVAPSTIVSRTWEAASLPPSRVDGTKL